jgi:hypothetical protein
MKKTAALLTSPYLHIREKYCSLEITYLCCLSETYALMIFDQERTISAAVCTVSVLYISPRVGQCYSEDTADIALWTFSFQASQFFSTLFLHSVYKPFLNYCLNVSKECLCCLFNNFSFSPVKQLTMPCVCVCFRSHRLSSMSAPLLAARSTTRVAMVCMLLFVM